MKLFLFVRELLCSHALQSHVTPTQGRLVQCLQTLAWGPEFCSRFLIWWPEPLLCVLALASLFGGAAGSTQAASENAVPHPELLISYRQWGWKGTASIKREKYSINRRRGIQKSNQIQELNKQLPKQTHYIDTQEIRQYWRDNELEDRMKETTIKIKRREIAKILRRHVPGNLLRSVL